MEIELSYQNFKDIVSKKNILWQYKEDNKKYRIFAIDETICYFVIVWKNGFETVESDVANINDFETNYKNIANKKIGIRPVRKFCHLTSSSTAILKNCTGTLHRVILNAKGSGQSKLTIYDNTTASGNIIAIIDTNTNSIGTFSFDVDFEIGLTVKTTATVGDLTIVYD